MSEGCQSAFDGCLWKEIFLCYSVIDVVWLEGWGCFHVYTWYNQAK